MKIRSPLLSEWEENEECTSRCFNVLKGSSCKLVCLQATQGPPGGAEIDGKDKY